MSKYFLPYLQIDITNKCNLNCAGCSHFSPLVTKDTVYFYDVNQYEKELKQLATMFEFGQIGLLGGEPLLHPDIEKFIEVSEAIYPNRQIIIKTNGSKTDLCNRLLDKYNNRGDLFKLQLSEYPEINSNNVNYNIKRSRSNFRNIGLDINGNQDKYKNVRCPGAKCINLFNGKLILCGIMRNIDLFINYFNLQDKMKICSDDYAIDIYNHNAVEIMDFLQNFDTGRDVCRFCNPSKMNISHSISKRDINEWISKE